MLTVFMVLLMMVKMKTIILKEDNSVLMAGSQEREHTPYEEVAEVRINHNHHM